MSYHNKIRTLEESFKKTEIQIILENNSDNPDKDKLVKLIELKNRYFNELRDLRKKQYDLDQEVGFDD